MSKVVEIQKEQFTKEVLESELPVLVDFWTEGCGPCEAMAPALDEVSVTLEGKLKVVKHEVTYADVMEKESEVAVKYEIMAFPSLFVFKNGEEVKRFIGFKTEDELLEFVKEVL